VAKRRDYPLEHRNNFIIAGILQMGISSSYIRSLIKRGFSVEYLVTKSVAEYIEKRKLYK
jgi:nicotinic acid mononucleotide adenylyltransferase